MSPTFRESYVACHDLTDLLEECAKAERLVLYADRYGGSGIRTHGGSGRCGIYRNFQLKGVGATPLIGRGAPQAYSDGRLSVIDAVIEAVWGEILAKCLPYGACQVHSIFLVDSGVREEGACDAILVRPVPLRPAHFMRATYFEPHDADIFLSADVERVAATCRLMHLLFCDASSELIDGSLGVEIFRLFGILAEQFAVSKSLRIVHGAVSPSNLTMEGKWLDFGSTSTVPGFDHLAAHNSGFWQDIQRISDLLNDLVFYLNKYRFRPNRHPPIDPRILEREFHRTYNEHLRLAFLRYLGIPKIYICRLGIAADDLGSTLVSIAKKSKLKDRSDFRSLIEGGTHHLGVLCMAALAGVLNSVFPGVDNLKDMGDYSDFYTCAQQVLRHVLISFGEDGISKEAAIRLMVINSLKAHMGASRLYEPNLRKEISNLLEIASDAQERHSFIGGFIKDISTYSERILGEWSNEATSIECGSILIKFYPVDNKVEVLMGGSVRGIEWAEAVFLIGSSLDAGDKYTKDITGILSWIN